MNAFTTTPGPARRIDPKVTFARVESFKLKDPSKMRIGRKMFRMSSGFIAVKRISVSKAGEAYAIPPRTAPKAIIQMVKGTGFLLFERSMPAAKRRVAKMPKMARAPVVIESSSAGGAVTLLLLKGVGQLIFLCLYFS
jgi:hypothetical protein